MARRKSPNVKIVMGRVRRVRIGLTLELMIAKITPNKTASKLFFTIRPGRKWAQRRVTIVVIMTLTINRITYASPMQC